MVEATAQNDAVNQSETVKDKTPENNSATQGVQKPSPAQDLRDIQALVVTGIYPGNMAPAVVKAYQLLEAMAREVEGKASAQAK